MFSTIQLICFKSSTGKLQVLISCSDIPAGFFKLYRINIDPLETIEIGYEWKSIGNFRQGFP